jgi:DNA-binding transcriptional LysR family regulator
MDSISQSVDLRTVEMRHLTALVAVAEERSFGRAATRLGYTQSAVSQQIAALEKIVGEPLFERPGGPKPVEITRAGELLLGHAEAIVGRMGLAGAELAGYREGKVGNLTIGTFQSVSVEILPSVITRFREERPDLQLRVIESDMQSDLLQRLAEGELDLTFGVRPVDSEIDLDVTELAHDSFVVISPLDTEVARGRRTVRPEELIGMPMIGQRAGDACQATLEGGMRKAGVEMDIVFRSNDNSAVQAMVRAGMGHAVMARLAVDCDDPGVLVREMVPSIPPRVITLVRRAQSHPVPAAERFIELTHEVCGEIMPGAFAPVRAIA